MKRETLIMFLGFMFGFLVSLVIMAFAFNCNVQKATECLEEAQDAITYMDFTYYENLEEILVVENN